MEDSTVNAYNVEGSQLLAINTSMVYGIYVCFNPYIKGLISGDRILLEYGKDAKRKIPKNPAIMEYDLNHYILVQEKLMNKTLELEYHQNGKKVPLKKESFI